VCRRFLKYCQRVYHIREELESVTDRRLRPQLPTFRVVGALFLMACVRAGSLNGMEVALSKMPKRCVWYQWLRGALPSADRLGEVAALVHVGQLRLLVARHYRQRRRKKTLNGREGNRLILVLDGHECFCSYRRCCPNCQKRSVRVDGETRVQYYHRYVAAYLFRGDSHLMLDMEMQGPKEGEITAARRLMERVLVAYPRAFSVVMGDALYADPELCKRLLAAGKHFIAVLKDDRRDLVGDFQSLADSVESVRVRYQQRECVCRDIEGFHTWPQVGRPVRVVSSEEKQSARCQATGKQQSRQSKWMWVTSLSQHSMDTSTLVQLGHRRWDIENYAFNELCNRWHADHIYHHDVNAMTAILLLTFLAYNLFHVWRTRGLQPELRQQYSTLLLQQHLRADYLTQLPLAAGRAPP